MVANYLKSLEETYYALYKSNRCDKYTISFLYHNVLTALHVGNKITLEKLKLLTDEFDKKIGL